MTHEDKKPQRKQVGNSNHAIANSPTTRTKTRSFEKLRFQSLDLEVKNADTVCHQLKRARLDLPVYNGFWFYVGTCEGNS